MEFQHRVDIRDLKHQVSEVGLQQLLERQFDTLNKPWNKGWGFSAKDGRILPTHVLFAKRNDAMTFAQTLSTLYGDIVYEPFRVDSPAPRDAAWTEALACQLITELDRRFTDAGFARPVIIGGVAKLGYSMNDLDLLMKPARAMTMDDAIDAIEALRPQISNDKSFTPQECADHDNVWFINLELVPDAHGVQRVVEFYMDEADFPFEQDVVTKEDSPPEPKSEPAPRTGCKG